MAYYNGYPATYQPYQYGQNTIQYGQIPNNGGIIWVQGEAGAKSYLVAPNTTVQLWDSESQVIYLKSADASGMPSIKTLDYTIRGSETSNKPFDINPNDFILRDEFNALKGKIDALQNEINKIKPRKKEGGHNG